MKLNICCVAVTLSLTIAGCSNGGTSSTPAVQTVNIAQTAKLQFAVGTATIAYSGGSFVGTNFVSTFRGSDGHSATLANTPTITGPASFIIGFSESTNTLSGTLPSVLSNALSATEQGAQLPTTLGASLGPLVGIFGYGMAGDNLLSPQLANLLQKYTSGVQHSNGTTTLICPTLTPNPGRGSQYEEFSPLVSGSAGPVALTGAAQSNELALPVGSGQNYDPNLISAICPVSLLKTNYPAADDPTLSVNYYGGPPAWPSPQGYGNAQFFIGYPIGFTDFFTTPVPGSYGLDVAYSTNAASTTYGHIDASANLSNTQGLPPITITSATVNSDGTGSVIVNVPSGLYEAVIFVRALDCDITERPVQNLNNYAIVTHATGTQQIIFASNLGPPNNAGQPTPTFCAGPSNPLSATAFAVGFDYPAYESSYPFNTTQTPKITNITGQADVTTSIPFPFTQGS